MKRPIIVPRDPDYVERDVRPRFRHRLGRWLLRDAPPPEIRLVAEDQSARQIQAMLLRLKRERGGEGLGLS